MFVFSGRTTKVWVLPPELCDPYFFRPFIPLMKKVCVFCLVVVQGVSPPHSGPTIKRNTYCCVSSLKNYANSKYAKISVLIQEGEVFNKLWMTAQ